MDFGRPLVLLYCLRKKEIPLVVFYFEEVELFDLNGIVPSYLMDSVELLLMRQEHLFRIRSGADILAARESELYIPL